MKDILIYKEFIGSVHYSADNNVFFGKLMGIDDLVTFEGKSVDELKRSFEEAVDDYLELYHSLNKSPLKSYKGTLIKPTLHRQAAHKSIELGLSLNQFIEQAVDEKLAGMGRNS